MQVQIYISSLKLFRAQKYFAREKKSLIQISNCAFLFYFIFFPLSFLSYSLSLITDANTIRTVCNVFYEYLATFVFVCLFFLIHEEREEEERNETKKKKKKKKKEKKKKVKPLFHACFFYLCSFNVELLLAIVARQAMHLLLDFLNLGEDL